MRTTVIINLQKTLQHEDNDDLERQIDDLLLELQQRFGCSAELKTTPQATAKRVVWLDSWPGNAVVESSCSVEDAIKIRRAIAEEEGRGDVYPPGAIGDQMALDDFIAVNWAEIKEEP